MNETPIETLDARGLNCPLPILRTKKAIAQIASWQLLEVIATDPGSLKDIESFCHQTGHELVESVQKDDSFLFQIRKQ